MCNNIVVRMPNWLGDGIMAMPVLENVKKHFSNARVTAMCIDNIAPLLENFPYVDKVFSFPKCKKKMGLTDVRNIVNILRCESYDLGILLPNSFSSAWCFWNGNIKRRIGYSTHWRSILLTDAVSLPENIKLQHLVLTYKMLLKPLGIDESDSFPKIYLTSEEIEHGKRLLCSYGIVENNILVGINPGAAYGPAKRWLPQRFREVTKCLLQDKNVRVIYFGDKSSKSYIKKMVDGLGSNVICLAGETSLRELFTLIKLSDVLLTNDSGPMHVAVACQTPVVALFGSTSDVTTGPYGEGIVIHKHVHCSPCLKKRCPSDFICMKKINVNEVYNALQKYILKK